MRRDQAVVPTQCQNLSTRINATETVATCGSDSPARFKLCHRLSICLSFASKTFASLSLSLTLVMKWHSKHSNVLLNISCMWLLTCLSKSQLFTKLQQKLTLDFHKSLTQHQHIIVSSVRSSSVYHGLLEGSSSHFFKFFKFFRFERESESERTQHVLYFWKAWDSRI